MNRRNSGNDNIQIPHEPLDQAEEENQSVGPATSVNSLASWNTGDSRKATFEDIVEKFAIIGEEDTVRQKVCISIFGAIAMVTCIVFSVLYRIRYGEAIDADPTTYRCRNNIEEKFVMALWLNWIGYLILSILSLLAIIAGPVVKVRAIKGILTTLFGFGHLILLIWTSIVRFDEAGDMCYITAEDPLLKEHGRFLKIMIIIQFNLYCPLFFC